jgi:hypothetical protein
MLSLQHCRVLFFISLPACKLNCPTLLPSSSWKLYAVVSIQALSVFLGSSTYPV